MSDVTKWIIGVWIGAVVSLSLLSFHSTLQLRKSRWARWFFWLICAPVTAAVGIFVFGGIAGYVASHLPEIAVGLLDIAFSLLICGGFGWLLYRWWQEYTLSGSPVEQPGFAGRAVVLWLLAILLVVAARVG